jgi:hypothetical protein
MGYVTGHRDEAIVIVRVHGHDVRTQFAQDAVQVRVSLGFGGRGGRKNPGAPLEEIGASTGYATKLRSGHGMASEEARVLHVAHDGAFYPGHVSHDEVSIR